MTKLKGSGFGSGAGFGDGSGDGAGLGSGGLLPIEIGLRLIFFLKPQFFDHDTVAHSAGEYSRGDVNTNSIEGENP